MKTEVVQIEGQNRTVLQAALALSMLSGKAFQLKNARSDRGETGFLRQDLTVIQSASEICRAKVRGNSIGSTELLFIPNQIQSGNYEFAMGNAHSVIDLAYTLMPALFNAKKTSTLTLSGATHREYAYSFEQFREGLIPIFKLMGLECKVALKTYGFVPMGGGQIILTINPSKSLTPIHLLKRGRLQKTTLEALFCHLSASIAKRELATAAEKLGLKPDATQILEVDNAYTSGNALTAKLVYPKFTTLLSDVGSMGKSADNVAKKVCEKTKNYLASDAVVDSDFALPILFMMCVVKSGSFTLVNPPQHLQYIIKLIEEFLPLKIELNQQAKKNWVLSVSNLNV